MQKHVNLVDLGESFPTHIYLQNMASIQPRTSPCEIDSRLQDIKIARLKRLQDSEFELQMAFGKISANFRSFSAVPAGADLCK